MIPSLIVAPWLLSKTSSKRVQFIGFAGCAVANFILAVAYGPLKKISALFFTLQLGQNEFSYDLTMKDASSPKPKETYSQLDTCIG